MIFFTGGDLATPSSFISTFVSFLSTARSFLLPFITAFSFFFSDKTLSVEAARFDEQIEGFLLDIFRLSTDADVLLVSVVEVAMFTDLQNNLNYAKNYILSTQGFLNCSVINLFSYYYDRTKISHTHCIRFLTHLFLKLYCENSNLNLL